MDSASELRKICPPPSPCEPSIIFMRCPFLFKRLLGAAFACYATNSIAMHVPILINSRDVYLSYCFYLFKTYNRIFGGGVYEKCLLLLCIYLNRELYE
jgi:hypothetical protein